MGFLYGGKHERPLSRAERRQLAVLAVATVVGLVAALVGVVVLMPSRDPLSPVLVLGGSVVVSAAGFLSMRRLVSVRRQRIQAAMIAVLALLWLGLVVNYVSDR